MMVKNVRPGGKTISAKVHSASLVDVFLQTNISMTTTCSGHAREHPAVSEKVEQGEKKSHRNFQGNNFSKEANQKRRYCDLESPKR